MFHITDKTEGYILQMVPLFIACFSIICITLLCPQRWLIVLLELPIWIVLFWWWHMQEVYARSLEFRRENGALGTYKREFEIESEYDNRRHQ